MEEKTITKQVNANHYSYEKYLHKGRWNSYWHQINEVMQLNCTNVLVIGCGDNIVADCLKKANISVTTYDIDIDLHSDYIGDVRDIIGIIKDTKFDCILCCQVLEHIPYEYLDSCLVQLREISNNVIISLPYCHSKFEIILYIPKIRNLRLLITLPKFYKRWTFNGEHYWEIGAKYYSLKKIKHSLTKYFDVSRYYLVPENTRHLFFILKAK